MLDFFLQTLLPSALVSAALALVLNYGLYLVLFELPWSTEKLKPYRHYDYRHTRADLLREIKHCILPEIYLATVVGVLLRSAQPTPLKPWLSLRWDFSPQEWWRIPLEVFVGFWLYEIYYYFLHRAMHRPRFFRYFHSVHHRTRFPTPFTGTSVNLLEAVSFYAFVTGMLFAPVHVISWVLWALSVKWGSLSQHSGHECIPNFFRRHPRLHWINGTRFHQLHHSHSFRHNYGFQTGVLDRLFGTVDPEYLRYVERSGGGR